MSGFCRPSDFEAHEARVCIHEGSQLADPNRVRRYTAEQYLRSGAEMADLFADIPEALANSVEIARRCNLTLTLGEARLPVFPAPAGSTIEEFIRGEAEHGLDRRLTALGDARAGSEQDYRERLKSELVVICEMGFAGYFLIVADFIRWARENGVPVGPGRGSGAGSLVAYALGITDIDPLKYDLLFERFLNPERVSMPDFDIDFCMDGRDRVIDYVAQRYGRERVSQIITYGSMAAKAVVRDVGRVLGMSYGFVDRIAKLIPFELGITLDDALDQGGGTQAPLQEDDEIRNLIDLARSLEGLTRNAGMHAGGVVIAPSVLTDFAPLYCDSRGWQRRHPVRQGRRRSCRTGQVRLPGPAHAHDHRPGGRHDQPSARHARRGAGRHRAAADGRRGHLPTAEGLSDDRGVPARIARHEGPDPAPAARYVRRHHRAGSAVSPGPLQSGMVDDFIARKHDGRRLTRRRSTICIHRWRKSWRLPTA